MCGLRVLVQTNGGQVFIRVTVLVGFLFVTARSSLDNVPLLTLVGLVFCVLLLGVDKAGIIRSLPLPNLSAVTRQAAREYFDNSWTLYETLFAGLKGEEGFYRYVIIEFSP